MWLLFMILIFHGPTSSNESKDPVIRYRVYESSQVCEASKAGVLQFIAKEYPSTEVSVTCSKLKPLGLPT